MTILWSVGQAESGRYHLYVGNACPWCHRVLLVLIFRGLLPHISVTFAVDDPERASRGGWVFDAPEEAFGCKDLRCETSGKAGRRTGWMIPGGKYDSVQPGYPLAGQPLG
jgi:glutathionyl-hydroquinone reductase